AGAGADVPRARRRHALPAGRPGPLARFHPPAVDDRRSAMRDWPSSRRDLLKRLGVGAACLPLLRARRGWGAPPPRKRLMVLELINGYRQQYWKPATGSLAAQTLPATSAAFDGVKDAMSFLPDLTNPGLPFSGRYQFATMFWGMMGGTLAGAGYRTPTGPTLDQVVAKALAAPGGRASLHLGVQPDLRPHPTNGPEG